MPGCWGVNTTATVVIHWTTQHSWKYMWAAPHRETTVPLVPQRPYPQPAGSSSRPAKDHYLLFWHLKMNSQCQEGSFSNRFKEPNPLITTGYSKENKGEIHESREDEKRKQKNTSEKSKTPTECSAVTCVYWENAGGARVLGEADPHVRNCSLSSVSRGFNISPG